ncbi:YciI family protein [Roseibium sediminicola]|uniref:YciI family protein n=1 Tax=Roseibium sediminicola TaxID=2933272 RepID=A0ABT0GTP8_9HYPH|nr:YciI family protein [Roseibium sp. CAU 1639]MCK7612178.1 YciI family protein [Roseibium sp. CAU 1639]
MNLFVIDLTYRADLSEIDRLLEAHRDFLKQHYAIGVFLASGPKVPRNGGIILAQGESREAIERVVEQDPFKAEGVADYSITEFSPVMTAQGFPTAA